MYKKEGEKESTIPSVTFLGQSGEDGLTGSQTHRMLWVGRDF